MPHTETAKAPAESRPMSVLRTTFLDHPQEAGETYLQHLRFTLKYAGALIIAALSLALHGLIPALLRTAASERISRIHAVFESRSRACGATAKPSSPEKPGAG
jgi:hypothetical protein